VGFGWNTFVMFYEGTGQNKEIKTALNLPREIEKQFWLDQFLKKPRSWVLFFNCILLETGYRLTKKGNVQKKQLLIAADSFIHIYHPGRWGTISIVARHRSTRKGVSTHTILLSIIDEFWECYLEASKTRD